MSVTGDPICGLCGGAPHPFGQHCPRMTHPYPAQFYMNQAHPETQAEEIARLQREIAERQTRIQQLLCGDPRVGVNITTQLETISGQGYPPYEQTR